MQRATWTIIAALALASTPSAGAATGDDDTAAWGDDDTAAWGDDDTYDGGDDAEREAADDDTADDRDEDHDGYTVGDGDCDDHDRYVYPGCPERIDQKDNDCNGLIDDVEPLDPEPEVQFGACQCTAAPATAAASPAVLLALAAIAAARRRPAAR